MIGHVFAAMNEMLDGIKQQYPGSADQEKSLLLEQIAGLKALSDEFIEQWLQFEEKLAELGELAPVTAQPAYEMSAAKQAGDTGNKPSGAFPCNANDLTVPEGFSGMMDKGQGYYKLFMFDEAAKYFQLMVAAAPECNMARLFLGMSQMHLRNWNEAQGHFQLLVVLSDFPKWVALGYNALGCIHAIRMNMALAEELFRKAYEIYPEFSDSLSNLQSCRQSAAGQLSLYFGSTELIYL
jgi:tetratricopeptide (TPR) repeat protein